MGIEAIGEKIVRLAAERATVEEQAASGGVR